MILGTISKAGHDAFVDRKSKLEFNILMWCIFVLTAKLVTPSKSR